MKHTTLTLLFCFTSLITFSQAKTSAFYMIGNYNYSEWERIEFNLTDEGRTILYSYKKNEAGYKLESLGIKYIGKQKALMVKIPTLNKTYTILQEKEGRSLLMISEDGKYKKRFPLGYEGPIDGRGMACDTCANEPEEAFELISSFFM